MICEFGDRERLETMVFRIRIERITGVSEHWP
jgi:hypothetical protein